MAHGEPALHASSETPLAGPARRLLDWLLPPQCLACGAPTAAPGALCAECWGTADFITDPMCRCCGLPFELAMPGGAVCGACLRDQPAFERARAVMVYDELSRRMILGLKYGDRTDMAPAFAEWLGRAGAELVADADWIAPVPLHWTRLFRRRFNQAAELARKLARDNNRAYAPDLLVRRRNTPSQAGLNAGGRRRNVRAAFAVKDAWRARIEGKRVLLIDDVMTTGATVSACAKALTRAGAGAVDVLTLARVVRPVGSE
jgi:ComF family protein